MPTLVRRELETLFQDEFSDIEERLRPRVAEIVMNLQPRLLGLYKQSQSPLSDYGPPNDPPTGGSDPSLTPALSHRTAGTDPGSTPATDGGGNYLPSGGDDFQFDVDVGEILNFDIDAMGIGHTWDSVPRSQADVAQSAASAVAVAAAGQDFSWDYEFDKILNPALFFPQAGSGVPTGANTGANTGAGTEAYYTHHAAVNQGMPSNTRMPGPVLTPAATPASAHMPIMPNLAAQNMWSWK